MARLSEVNSRNQGKLKKVTTKKPTKQKVLWTMADETKIISQEKIDILNHKAKYKTWIGGKGAGKTLPVITRGITLQETDYSAQLLALKKYKSGAATRLHVAINNVALQIKSLGFDIPDYEKGITETFRMRNKRKKHANQTIEYGSFDDANGLAGIEAKNLGWFAQVHIEEPVLIDDEGKLPSRKEWKAAMDVIEDSVNRSNTRHMLAKKRNIPTTQYHFTMNPWDEHPLIEDAEVRFPEEEFFEWIKEDLLNNHTKAKYDPVSDYLTIRLTKFANPVTRVIEGTLEHFKIETMDQWRSFDKTKIDWEDDTYSNLGIFEEIITNHLKDNKNVTILKRVKHAIKSNNSLDLARYLGLKYEGSQGNAKTYNLENLQTIDVLEYIKENDCIVEGIAVAWDIDLRKGRSMVATPTYNVLTKINPWTESRNILIGKQRFIKAFGDGDKQSQLYIDEMKRIHQEIKEEIIQASNQTSFKKGPFIYFDENKWNFMREMKDQVGFWRGIGKAKKHGRWDIINRQDNIQLGIETGFYVIDQKNMPLINRLKTSYIKEGSKKRDESGKNESKYDEINSMEYALYPWRMDIHTSKHIGKMPEKEVKHEHTN